ncbi:hypothetical protein PIB30_067983 [Stylosanthes scabra]|uniref:Uncharacterized protein n=1 Tax=Stylosanthes scabra TaxID=79078 RepID=A0ABU6XKZ3_9FABA|nr:hypothetical protein [Stylosanthes scabra]
MRRLPRVCVVRGNQGAAPKRGQSCLGMDRSLSSTNMHPVPRICVEFFLRFASKLLFLLSRQFKEMEMQGIPVTMANLAIHRQRKEEINQERMRYNQILQEVAAQQAREANQGKTREVVPDSEDEFVSSESEEF